MSISPMKHSNVLGLFAKLAPDVSTKYLCRNTYLGKTNKLSGLKLSCIVISGSWYCTCPGALLSEETPAPADD